MKTVKYQDTVTSKDSCKVHIDTVSGYISYRITGFELTNPENCIDLMYIRIWNVIFFLTYRFYCEKFDY